ncbi:MAG TPA: hypothetical protein [Caudoviricetes sp.]|nr:MAG TPA: hypothetical protein [Caudoviricetes sp.]
MMKMIQICRMGIFQSSLMISSSMNLPIHL